jgi:hypothetical protein
MRSASCVIPAALAATAALAGEESGRAAQTVTVVPGARYQASWFRRLMLGGHWREAWTTPIEVDLLDLTFDGGLSPDRESGGWESYNLRLKSANGRTWVFRSVDKDPKRKLDPDAAQGWIGDLVQDLISGAHPCGPLMVAPLLEAAGVFHATPRLVVMPDDPRLGEFREKFAGRLGTFEERPEHHLPGVDKVEDTLDLFERLDRRSDERVDARDYLRARLIDILVGDWDRHTGQYRWVRLADGDRRVWRVVPRDRDEAFSRFDGAMPSVMEYYGKPIAGWGDTYPPIDKITFAGWYTDRRFLVALDRTAWEAVTAEVAARVTDTVIDEAVHRLPPPLFAQAGEQLQRALKSRRDRLAEASKEFYALLAHEVDVRGTTGADDFRIDRHPDGSVSVAIRPRDSAAPYFQRTFVPSETGEIRLYTMGGGDRVVEEGKGTNAILLRVIAPPGTSEIADRGPQASATRVYTPIEPAALSNEELAKLKETDPRVEERRRYEVFRDWGSDTLFYPQLSYDSTRGLFFGAYMQRTSFGFGLDPYAAQQSFGAAWSTGLSRPRVEYGARFHTRSPFDGLLYVAYSGVEQASFYGFGNETERLTNLVSSNFYDARQEQVVVNPLVEFKLLGALRARTGIAFKHVGSVDQAGGLIGELKPSGTNGMSVGSAQLGLVFARSSGTYPLQRTVTAEVTGSVAPDIFSNPETFAKVRGSVSAAYGTHFVTDVQLSARVSGERNFGTYPFFEAAFLGGQAGRSALDVTGATSGNLLRGYDLNRFAGDAAVAANTEIDLELGTYSAFLPLRYGVFGLGDVGRVFVDGESSTKWHTGVGGGIWLGLFANSGFVSFASSLKAAMVHSDEGTSFYLFSGFAL